MERILIRGTLNITQLVGRNGIFNATELTTKIGKFKIRHSSLEQFEPGSYHGEFELMEIYQRSGFSNGTVWVNQCAALNWDLLAELILEENDQDLPGQHMSVPMNECEDEQAVDVIQIAENIEVVGQSTLSLDGLEYEDFGEELVINEQQVKLMIQRNSPLIKIDASISDRLLIASMRTLLKEAGYKFEIKTQSWIVE